MAEEKGRSTEEALRKISSHANRGTFRQFHTVIAARLADRREYRIELEGSTITFLGVRKEGGFLGIGARTVTEPLLKLTKQGNRVIVAQESLDETFVHELARVLGPH